MTPRKQPQKRSAEVVRRVLIYVRISKDRANEISTDVQENVARRYARERGWQIVGKPYIDRGRSAFNGERRKNYEQMLVDIEAGVGDTILVYRLDRLSRSVTDFGQLWRRVEAAGAEFVSVNDSFDTTTAMGRAMLQIAMVFSELESGIKSERIRDWHEERTARGEVPTGPRSFGFAEERAGIIPEEGALIRDAARRIVNGAGVHGIVNEWNAAGILTARGNPWSRKTLSNLLMNPHTAGLRNLDGDLVTGSWKPVLSRKLYDDVCAVLLDPDRRTNTSNTRRHFLVGIVRCGACGTPMAYKGTGAGPRYACRGRAGYQACTKVSIDIEKTDEIVRAAIEETFGNADLRAAYVDSDPGAVVASLEDELEKLAADYGRGIDHGGIGRAEWVAARSGLEERLVRAREIAAEPRPVKIDLARFEDEPLDAQRMFVSWAFEDISIRAGRRGGAGFDESRIMLTPRPRAKATRARKTTRAK